MANRSAGFRWRCPSNRLLKLDDVLDAARYLKELALMPKEFLSICVMASLVFTAGCNGPSDKSSSATGVFNVAADDEEMRAAIKKAQDTFSFFEKNWQTIESDGCSVKLALPTVGGEPEHIWFSPIEISGDKIVGECANDPVSIPNLQVGDLRTVSREDLSDWMIVVGNQCYGGYTIRVLAERDPSAAPPLDFVDPPVE